MGSFADLLDRTLADLRQTLVSEHIRLLHGNEATGSAPASDKLAAPGDLTVVTVAQQQPPSAFPKPTTECGTQTRVDWSWPERPFTQAPPTDFKAKPDELAFVGAVSMQPYQSDDNGCQKLPARLSLAPGTRASRVSTRKSVSKTPSIILQTRAKPSLTQSTSTLAFQGLNSLQFRNIKEGKAMRQSEVPTQAWKRLLKRGKKAPLEMLDAIMGFVIIANSLAIGASCDTRDWETGWLVIDSIFVTIFLLEALLKVWLLGVEGYLCRGALLWSWFELLILAVSIAEIVATVVMTDSSGFNTSSLFRVVRLVRLTKLLRVCRVPMAADLVMMVNGLIGGLRTLIWAIVLILFPLFVVALVMRETLGEEHGNGQGAESFSTLPKSCFNIFRCLVIEDCSEETGRPIFVLVAHTYGWSYSVIYSMTLLLMKFGLYNVIIAIFVEQTVEAAKYNETYQKRQRLAHVSMFQEKSLEMAELAYSLKTGINPEVVACTLTLDEIQQMELSADEFTDLCGHPEFQELLTALDVAQEDHLDLFDTLDVDGGGSLDLGEIVSGISKLRGDARKSDIVAVILIVKHLNRCLTEFKADTGAILEGHKLQLSSIQRALQR